MQNKTNNLYPIETRIKGSNPVYFVSRASRAIVPDGNWYKQDWESIPELHIKTVSGKKPAFLPKTSVKVQYDSENIYIIFLVNDCCIRSVTTKINGDVFKDSCVEFFFSPSLMRPFEYFNLEINCGGMALMHYNRIPRKEFIICNEADVEEIEIAHSMPCLIDPEIREQRHWSLEVKLPLKILGRYTDITNPGKGVKWRANFYKTAEISSNAHYLMWSGMGREIPDFHTPADFGRIVFE